MVLMLTLQWHLGSLHMEGSSVKGVQKIFITHWHPARQHHSVRWWRSAFLSPRPLVFIMCLLFPSVRLFFAVWRCQSERVFFPLPWLQECVLMAVRRDTLCIVLGCVVCQLSRTVLARFSSVLLSHYKCTLWGPWQLRQTCKDANVNQLIEKRVALVKGQDANINAFRLHPAFFLLPTDT